MPANHFSVELDDRNVHPEAFVPVGIPVDVADLDIEPVTDQRQQLLEQDLAQVTALPAVDAELAHSGAPRNQRFRNRRRQLLQAVAAAQTVPPEQQAHRYATQYDRG